MYIGKHVKLLLQGNLILEGIVKDWFEDQVILTSLDKKSISIVMHPEEDIRVIKVILEPEDISTQSSSSEDSEPIPDKKEIKTQLEKKFDEVYNSPSEDNLRIKTLSELKSQLVEQEKAIISEKLKNHEIGEVRTVKYELPRFLKKQSI